MKYYFNSTKREATGKRLNACKQKFLSDQRNAAMSSTADQLYYP